MLGAGFPQGLDLRKVWVRDFREKWLIKTSGGVPTLIR
jgi:hypothetical protein